MIAGYAVVVTLGVVSVWAWWKQATTLRFTLHPAEMPVGPVIRDGVLL